MSLPLRSVVAHPLRRVVNIRMLDLHPRIAVVRRRLASLQQAHPNAFVAGGIAACTLALVAVVGPLGLAWDVLHDLPSASQLRDVTAMAQATTLYDRNNQPAFTIFHERRV